MISIILVEPSIPGNIGAVARVMANFDFKDLVLINPKCDHLDEEAQGRSKRARPILRNAKVGGDELYKEFDYLIATTSQLGTDYNIKRTPVEPKELVQLLKGKTNRKIGLVFGPEGPGLSNKDIDRCDFVMTIPTHGQYHSMNLSHAVAIILYELYCSFGEEKVTKGIRPVIAAEKAQAMKQVEAILSKYNFHGEPKKENHRQLWKKIVGRLFLSRREMNTLLGFLRKCVENK
ncbi:MAG: RNA methyltransferase [Nanoarchaeota archaeon]